MVSVDDASATALRPRLLAYCPSSSSEVGGKKRPMKTPVGMGGTVGVWQSLLHGPSGGDRSPELGLTRPSPPPPPPPPPPSRDSCALTTPPSPRAYSVIAPYSECPWRRRNNQPSTSPRKRRPSCCRTLLPFSGTPPTPPPFLSSRHGRRSSLYGCRLRCLLPPRDDEGMHGPCSLRFVSLRFTVHSPATTHRGGGLRQDVLFVTTTTD